MRAFAQGVDSWTVLVTLRPFWDVTFRDERWMPEHNPLLGVSSAPAPEWSERSNSLIGTSGMDVNVLRRRLWMSGQTALLRIAR